MSTLITDQPGESVLMMGNEAIARGAIEAGVDFCASYPGTPSTEITEALARVAKHFGLYGEWSTNAIVYLEAATAASLAGLRAIVAMKQNGVNVCSDFLMTVNLSGTKGGLVIIAADDLLRPDVRHCWACGGTKYWTNRWGARLCRTCHPPGALP